MNKIAEFYQSIPAEVVSVIIIAVAIALFVTVMVILERPIWKRNKRSALRALKKLNWWNYKELSEAEKKSPIPEVKEAAREKNKLGTAIHNSLEYGGGKGKYPENGGPGADVPLEPNTLAVYRNGEFLGGVTALLPEDIRPSCKEAADHTLTLTYDQEQVGTYTDGSLANVSVVKGKLMHDGKLVWNMSEIGGAPPSQKYWGSMYTSGTRADPTGLILSAAHTVEKRAKRAARKSAR